MATTEPDLILASASPRRRDLLAAAGLRFKVVPSLAPEMHATHCTARELAVGNAARKARAVARLHPHALVLGADTLVCLGVRLFGKPADLKEAKAMLQSLQGRTHQVVTGVALIHGTSRRLRCFAEVTDVTFRALTGARIRAYLAAVDPLDKAGAYAIQEQGEALIERIGGSRSNVIGLPMERLLEELRRWPWTGRAKPARRASR